MGEVDEGIWKWIWALGGVGKALAVLKRAASSTPRTLVVDGMLGGVRGEPTRPSVSRLSPVHLPPDPLKQPSEMAEASFRVLSTSPLNSEPPLSSLISSFLTPSSSTYNRNHGAPLSFDPSTYTLSVTSEVTGLAASQSSFSLESIKAAESKTDVVAVLACAGNRRMEMNAEKEVEGLQWGASALANTKWTGQFRRFPPFSST